MKTWQWIVFLIIVYLIFLIAYAPATLVQHAIKDNPNIQLISPRGTLFSGNADQIVINGIIIDNATWSLSALNLLWLSINVDINAGTMRNTDKVFVKGNASTSILNLQSVSLSDFQAFVPVKSILAQVKNLPVAVTAEGRIRLDIAKFESDKACIALQGTGSWANAAVSAANQRVDLGDFDARLSCQENNYAIAVAGENALRLDATFVLQPDGQITQSGRFRVDSLPPEVQQAAPFFGTRNSQGEFVLHKQMRF